MKKHQKLIALSVAVAFLCLLQASTMPLRAEQSPGQSETTMKSAEQGPNFIEEEGAPYAAKKKSIVPIVLIGVGVIAVAAVLVLVVFKTSYNITGTWTIHIDFTTAGYTDYTSTWVFTGSKESGTFVEHDAGSTYPGTYTVTNKKDVWFKYASYSDTYVGQFTSKNQMSGTFSTSSYNGTWSATKTSSSTASSPSLPQAQSSPTPSKFRHGKK
jgi:hypothetical protein